MRLSTSTLRLAAVLAVVAVSPELASADTVAMSSLPETTSTPKIPVSASSRPDKVLATEHVDGFYPAMVPLAKRKQAEDQGYRTVTIFASEKDAQDYTNEGKVPSGTAYQSSTTRACLSTWGSLSPRVAMTYRFKPYEAPKPTQAQIAQLIKQHRWPPPKPKPAAKPVKPVVEKDAVYLVHLERLSPAADTVTIDSVDAFVDIQTMGVRLAGKSSEKLARVGTGPNGIGVYGARASGGLSDFLVTGPDLPAPASEADREAEVNSLSGFADRMLVQSPAGGASQAGCGYSRFSLTSKPGTGQMATVFANAFLPPAADPSDADNAEPTAKESDGDDEGEGMREQLEQQARANRSQRARPLAINVSLSQLTSEPAPLLSVTFGWAGKDQRLSF